MSAQTLQRVIVRLLHDPDLDRATRGAQLTGAERGWLGQVDPRRWRADPMRRYRMLQALMEEYPVSAALSVRAHGVAQMNAFFESAAFHHSVQSRRALGIDFGAWLIDAFHGGPGIAQHARIEHAIARVRRAPTRRRPADPTLRWQLAPWIGLGRGPLDAWHRIRGQLGAHPGGMMAAILDLTVHLNTEPGPDSAWLVDGTEAPRVEALPDTLYQALHGLRRPQTWSECRAALIHAGAEPDDADDLLRGFIDDVLLTVRAD